MANKDLRAEMRLKVGIPYVDELDNWIAAIAANGQDQPALTVFERLAEAVIRNTTVAALGFSYTTLAAQTMGVTTSFDRLVADQTYGSVAPAVMTARLGHGVAMAMVPSEVEKIFQASPEMRFRLENTDRDLRAAMRQFKGKDGYISRGAEFGMRSIAAMQLYTVDIPTWVAAYNTAKAADPVDDKRAVAYADRVVRMSQSGGGIKDLSALQRRRGLFKASTMFYSFFSALYGIVRSIAVDLGQNTKSSPIGAPMRAAVRTFIVITLQEMGMALIKGKLPELDPEDPEEQDLASFMVEKTGLGLVSGVPLVRDIASGMFSDYGYSGSAASMFPESVVKSFGAISDALEDPNDDKPITSLDVIKPLVLLAGTLTGKVPSVQINRSLDGIEALYNESHNSRWWDALTGYSPKQAERRD